MPWKETNTMDQRLRFIGDVLRDEESFSELCRRYGISRETGYKWRSRYLEDGAAALSDRPRAPKRHPNATAPKVVELLLEARRAHPRWGPRKLVAVVGREYPGLVLPSASTVGELLRRNGLTVARRRRRSAEGPASHLGSQEGPNATWAIDFKGHFRTRDGRYCYPLTLQDGHSRYLLRCQGLARPKAEEVRPVLDAAFREYGLPEAMRSDNGTPFAGTGFTGLTALSIEWVKQGIRLDRTRKASPQDNGRLERLHRTLEDEVCTEPCADLSRQQAAFVDFRREYNETRPHEALQMRTPTEVYTPSGRLYRPVPLPPEYPGMLVRKVAGALVGLGGWAIHVTPLLDRESLGCLEVEEGVYELRFYEHVLGRFDLRTGVLSNGNATRQARHYEQKPGRKVPKRRRETRMSPFRVEREP